MALDQNPLKDWASLGNNMIWRADGAVVYPLFQTPRSGPSARKPWDSVPSMHEPPPKPAPPKGPWLARHPVGGFLGRFDTTEEAVRALDAVHPLVAAHEYHVPPRIQKILDQLMHDPELTIGLAQALAPISRQTVVPWERSHSFGGSMIRKTAGPVQLCAVVAHRDYLEDGKDPGYYTFPRKGNFRWRIWEGRSWLKGAADDIHTAMDEADAALVRTEQLLAEGRPIAGKWEVNRGELVRRVWSDPSHHTTRANLLTRIVRVQRPGQKRATWRWHAYPAASRLDERFDTLTVKTRREAKEFADNWLRGEGWVLR